MRDQTRSAPTYSFAFALLQAFGWLSLPGMIALTYRLVYEQTVLTWRYGMYPVGYALAHGYTILFFWLLLSLVIATVYLLSVAAVSMFRLFRGQGLHFNLSLIMALVFLFGALLIRHEFWMAIGVRLGLAQAHQAEFLVYGAASGRKYLVNAALKNGLPVDATESSSTALNAACVNKKIEMAHYLISKGADLRRAPECKWVAEIGGKVPPRVPGTTIEVRP